MSSILAAELASVALPQSMLQLLLEALLKNLPTFLNLGALLVLVMVVKVAVKILSRPSVKGMIGEAMVNWAGLSRLARTRYLVLRNVFIPSIRGDGMTELDHVVVSAHGIFVIETKNYSGWIFGGAQDRTWTQLHYKKKGKFENPLKQNEGHVNALAAFLGLPHRVFHSVIFFIGEATLKTPMPPNVLTSGLLPYIEARHDILLDERQFADAWKRLSMHDSSQDKRTVRREHISRLSSYASTVVK